MTRLTVKLIGHLLDDLSDSGISLDTAPIEVDDGITIPELARHIGLAADAEFFAMVNEEHVPNETWSERRMADGDEVVFCPPLKGG